ncbi:MAG: undecaprenyl-diphosphate phosphatase [Oscillospiraceae bacterium]|nr:undecaprenyl-diphosphate phosphatase [Oscillospiraceae bacterium]
MNLIDVIIQGIIQGVTEFLPISSSGHLSVYQHFFGTDDETSLLLIVMLHIGTLCSVLVAFRKEVWGMIKELFRLLGDIFRFRNILENTNESRRMIFMVFIATLPLAAAYFLNDFVKGIATDDDIIIEGVCFLITGLLLFIAFFWDRGRRDISLMKPLDAFLVGIAQLVAIVPGISRSGSTTAVAALRGLKKDTLISFSFILSIPAILAASASEILAVSKSDLTVDLFILALGFVVSAVFGSLTIWLIRWLIKKDRYVFFSYYLFLVGSITLTVGVFEHI